MSSIPQKPNDPPADEHDALAEVDPAAGKVINVTPGTALPTKVTQVPISVVILTLNEEINIAQCLASCAWCGDVHVLDSGSTDQTQAIAREFGAQVHVHPFKSFGEQRNWAIDNIDTKYDWIFHLDADERFTDELVEVLEGLMSMNPTEAGFHIPHKVMFMGRWLRYSAGYPTYQMRLFHKKRMRFIDYGHGQREDENAVIGVLDVPYLHFSFSKGIYEWMEKHNRYSTLEAMQILVGKEYKWKFGDLFMGSRTRRWRAWKELVYRLPFRAELRWLGIILINRGLFEGKAGMTYAKLIYIYENMISIKLKVLRNPELSKLENNLPTRRVVLYSGASERAALPPESGSSVRDSARAPALANGLDRKRLPQIEPCDAGEDDPSLTLETFLQDRLSHLAKPEKRILITGGSGFIGTNLTRFYSETNATVLNLSIDAPRDASQAHLWQQLDITERERTRKAVHDFDPHIVFHLAARTDLDETNNIEGYAANTAGVENILDAVSGLKNIERLIVTSSQLVCRPGYIPTDEHDYRPHTVYGQSKVETERITQAWDSLPCPWTITRPTSIWGPWFDIPYRTFFETIARGRYYHQRGMDPLRSFGFVGNIVQQYAALALAPADQIDRRTFYMSDYKPTRVRNWADLVQEKMGKKPIREIPMAMLRLAAYCGDTAQFLGIKRVPITSFRLKNLTSDNYIDMSNVEDVVGPSAYNLAEGTRLTIQWMRDHDLC